MLSLDLANYPTAKWPFPDSWLSSSWRHPEWGNWCWSARWTPLDLGSITIIFRIRNWKSRSYLFWYTWELGSVPIKMQTHEDEYFLPQSTFLISWRRSDWSAVSSPPWVSCLPGGSSGWRYSGSSWPGGNHRPIPLLFITLLGQLLQPGSHHHQQTPNVLELHDDQVQLDKIL